MWRSLVLSVVAILLAVVVLPIAFLCEVAYLACERKLSTYLWNIAVGIDQLGNVYCVDVFNWLWLRKHSTNRFGNPDETISSVLGKNKRTDTLSLCGKALARLLNAIEPNHVEDSIEDI